MPNSAYSKLRNTLGRWSSASQGNVTIMFGVVLVAMVGTAGAAIDYIRLIEQRTVFSAAADSAVLAAISSAREAEKNGLASIPKRAKDAALNAWKINIATSSFEAKAEPNIIVSKTGSAWTAKVSYDEVSPTAFMSLLGVKAMPLKGEASASTTISKVVTYWDFHVVVDDSSSMGIGATQADMDALKADPSINCAFACHWANYSAGETDSASIAKSKGIKLRIDVVDDAVDSMVNEMISSKQGNNVRAKLWGLNDTAKTLVDLTTKLADVKDYNIELYKTPVSVGNTNYETAMAKLLADVGKAGDGKSAVDPKKAVFIVTDGIHDTGFWTGNATFEWYSDHIMGTIDPAACTAMKNNGVLVGVLYIDYITPNGYEGAMDPVKPGVLPSLQSCSSEGLFFNATSPAEITKSMKEMLAAAMGMGAVHLTE